MYCFDVWRLFICYCDVLSIVDKTIFNRVENDYIRSWKYSKITFKQKINYSSKWCSVSCFQAKNYSWTYISKTDKEIQDLILITENALCIMDTRYLQIKIYRYLWQRFNFVYSNVISTLILNFLTGIFMNFENILDISICNNK